MFSVRPQKPIVAILISIFIAGLAIAFLTSPYINLGLIILSIFMLSMAIFFLLLIDQSYASIDFDGSILSLTSFFRLRKLRLGKEKILGYEIQQRVDEFNGLHNMIVLVLTDQRRIVLPKIAYSDYTFVQSFFESNFQFLEYRPMKFADFFKKWVPIISLISGLLAILVALQKLF
jgi:hypothetical protein